MFFFKINIFLKPQSHQTGVFSEAVLKKTTTKENKTSSQNHKDVFILLRGLLSVWEDKANQHGCATLSRILKSNLGLRKPAKEEVGANVM